MRVLHVISGLGGGGAEAILYRLCTASPERIADTVVSLTTDGVYAAPLRAAGLSVHALGMPRRLPSLGGVFRLRRIIRDVRPDIIQTWLYHGDLIGSVAARLAGHRRVVWGLHFSNVDPVTTPLSTRLVLRTCVLLSGRLPARIISCSASAAKLHCDLGYPPEKMVLVRNGYDCNVFTPHEERRQCVRNELGVACGVPLIGMVARFDSQKDVGNLLDALASIARAGEQFMCVLAGTDMDASNVALTMAINQRRLGDRVKPVGRRTDISAVMTAMDVNVLPSAYGEAFPNVIAEAMACGTPSVATDVGDVAEIVGDTGWVVPRRDSGALAKALLSALVAQRDSVAWEARKNASRDRIVDNYGIDRMVEGYEQTWRQVLRT